MFRLQERILGQAPRLPKTPVNWFEACVQLRSSREVEVDPDNGRGGQRQNLVEQAFNELNHWRRISMRHH